MAAVVGLGVGFGIAKALNQLDDCDPTAGIKTYSRPAFLGTIVDAIAAPTLIAMGILGALGVVALSPAASYAMIGVGAGCALPHLALIVANSRKLNNPLNGHIVMFKEGWGSALKN